MNLISTKYLVTEDNEDFETAVSMFKKALEIYPEYSQPYSGLAWGYMLLAGGQNEPSAFFEMEKYNDMAYRLDTDSAMANILRAVSLLLKGEFEQGLSFCRRALELNSNLAEVNFIAGVICRKLGLYSKSIKYAEKSIVLDPYFPLSYGLLGRCYSYQGDSEKAMFYWKKGYQLMPAFFFYSVAIEHTIMGNFEKAEKIIKKSVVSEYSSNRIKMAKAFLYAFRGEKEKALELEKEAEIYAFLGLEKEALNIIEVDIEYPQAFNYLYLN